MRWSNGIEHLQKGVVGGCEDTLDFPQLDCGLRAARVCINDLLTSRIVSGSLIFSAIMALSRSILLAKASAS